MVHGLSEMTMKNQLHTIYTHDDGLTSEVRDKIIRLVLAIVPEAKIYLYGSRARGTFRDNSDIDIAIDAQTTFRVGEIKNILEGSAIPQKIDVTNLQLASQEFKAEVMRDAVPWKI